MCKTYVTDQGWLPFCCEVCWDSHDAEFQRDCERGRFDHLFKETTVDHLDVQENCSCTAVEDPWCEVHGEQYLFPLYWRIGTLVFLTWCLAWMFIVLVSGDVHPVMHIWNLLNVAGGGYIVHTAWKKY